MIYSRELAEQLAVLWFQAPMVIAQRLQDMALSGGSARGSAEMNRMVDEKMAASAESAVALGAAMMKHGMHVASAVASGNSKAMSDASSHMTVAALAPYVKRVRANARRLSR